MKPFNILCIFHVDVHPSLRIWPNGNFYCHGCGEKGNVSDHYYLEVIFRTKIHYYIQSQNQLVLEGV